LVVDDDPAVLKSIAQFLRGISGGEVMACDSPYQALQVLSTAPEAVALLVTDLDMPGLNGMQLARSARAGSSQVQILLISGREIQPTDALSAGVDAFLPKPFTPKELLATVLALIHPRDGEEGLPRQQLQSREN
jgi:DNA-binding response OmpR family regulator